MIKLHDFNPQETEMLIDLASFCRINFDFEQPTTTRFAVDTQILRQHAVFTGGFFPTYLQGPIGRSIKKKEIDCFILNQSTQEDITKIEKTLIAWIQRAFPGKSSFRYTPYFNAQKCNLVYLVYEVKDTHLGNFKFMFTEFKTRKELIDSFDFVHCQMSFHNDRLYLTRNIFDAIMQKKLIYTKQTISSMNPNRVNKFIELGYKTHGSV